MRETDEEHPGHRTQANDEAGSIVLHVGHDMDERKKTAISNEEASHEGAVTVEHKREETNGKQTENVIETGCLGEELLGHCTRTDGGRFYRVTCRPRHERESKERQIEWSRLSPG